MFIASCIGGGLAGAITGLMRASYFGTAGGVFGALSSINPTGIDASFYAFLISFAVAVFGTAILICVIGYQDKEEVK